MDCHCIGGASLDGKHSANSATPQIIWGVESVTGVRSLIPHATNFSRQHSIEEERLGNGNNWGQTTVYVSWTGNTVV